jgi:hypothetical protein
VYHTHVHTTYTVYTHLRAVRTAQCRLTTYRRRARSRPRVRVAYGTGEACAHSEYVHIHAHHTPHVPILNDARLCAHFGLRAHDDLGCHVPERIVRAYSV